MAKDEVVVEEEKIELSKRVSILEMLLDGMCPSCLQMTADWRKPQTLSVRETLSNLGIKWETGHKANCGRKI